MQLNNQIILVTGASKGIGHEIARYLISKGARVAIHYNRGKEEAESLLKEEFGSDSRIFYADLSDVDHCKNLWSSVLKEFGRIDSVVFNAGVFLQHDINDSDLEWYEVWKKTMAINLDSIGLITKWGIEHFKKSGGGRFIYIGSRAVFRGETEEYLAYAASKGGMVSLARSVARSFGKDNIKAFIVAPGFVKTAMAEQFIDTYGEERVLTELALTEMTEPKHVSPLIGLMCSGQMDHATGATIDLNAGSHIR